MRLRGLLYHTKKQNPKVSFSGGANTLFSYTSEPKRG